MYMCAFQPGNFTGWGSEGVKLMTCTVCRWGHPVWLWFQLLRVCGVPWRGRGVGATTSRVLPWPSCGTGVMRWCPRCCVDTIWRRLHLGLRRIWYGCVPFVCWHDWWALVWGFSETECVWLSWVKTLIMVFCQTLWIYCPCFYSSARSQFTQIREDFYVCIKTKKTSIAYDLRSGIPFLSLSGIHLHSLLLSQNWKPHLFSSAY